MILAAMMLVSAQTPTTLMAVERLTPLAAGELVLAGQDHGPIATVIYPPPRGPAPPGAVTLEMVERSVSHAGGCSRKRWTIEFFHRPDMPKESATLTSARGATEIARPRSGVCPDGQYVQLNGGIEPAQAFDALRHLDAVRAGRRKASFSCSDSTSSTLCASPRTIRDGLAQISPWAVMRDGDSVIFWLGVPGQIVTEMRYNTMSPDRVIIRREIPPPA